MESFATYLTHKPFSPTFADDLASQIRPYLKGTTQFSIPELHIVDQDGLQRLLPQMACLVILGAAPTQHKIILEIDTSIAAFCIDRLLGGAGKAGRIQRPLTAIEEGILSFLILHTLSQFHEGWVTGREISLSLDRFESEIDGIQDILDSSGHFHVAGVRLSIGKKVGYARIIIPEALATQSFLSPPEQGEPTDTELKYMRKRLATLGETLSEARFEIATLDLTQEDVVGLESGDIVILENHEVVKQAQGIEGRVYVKIGDGYNGTLLGRFFSEADAAKIEIQELRIQHEPPEAPMADSNMDEEEISSADLEVEASVSGDNLAETQGLLRDVAAPVVVELGRIRLNANQIVRLKTGQILRLPRGPNDPVNLVVNGKLFARGELIEVDGELGIRLLQVSGS